MNKYKDFDKFREEAEDKVIFKLRGHEYELPPSPEFKTVLKIQKMVEDKDKKTELASQQIKNIVEWLLGEEQFEQLVNDGVNLREIEELFRWLWFEVYNEKQKSGKKNVPSTSSQTGN